MKKAHFDDQKSYKEFRANMKPHLIYEAVFIGSHRSLGFLSDLVNQLKVAQRIFISNWLIVYLIRNKAAKMLMRAIFT